jgi:DNA polymerase
MYDSTEIGPWSRWQGNLDAELVVVGRDWGDVPYFQKWEGRDQERGNPTNENLQELLAHIGIKIGKPRDIQENVIFLTNIILCLKQGGLQAPTKKEWYQNCTRQFLKPLIDIINPRAIVALGEKESKEILDQYHIRYPKSGKLSGLTSQSPYKLTQSTSLFCFYHCGARGININRPMARQKDDWSKVAEWRENKFR